MKDRLVLDLKPSQLVLSKDGTLKVGFFDKLCEIDVKTDDKGRKISFKSVPKLYIHIEMPHDPTTVVEKVAGERKIVDGEDIRWVAETALFERAYNRYLEVKNEVKEDPYAKIEELQKQLIKAQTANKENKVFEEVVKKAPKKEIKEATISEL